MSYWKVRSAAGLGDLPTREDQRRTEVQRGTRQPGHTSQFVTNEYVKYFRKTKRCCRVRPRFYDGTLYETAILTEMDGRDGFLYHDAHQLPSFLTPAPMGIGGGNGGSHTPTLLGGRTPSLHQLEEAEVDVVREKRNQRYIATIVTCFALCLCPLMILRLVKNMVLETYDNSGHFDITFITFVWVAFLPTITTPALYAAWRLTRTTKERLCSYLQFGFRGRRSAHAQNFTPMFYSCHARAAHRLSLEPALAPSSPHAHHTPHHGGHTSRSDNLRPYSLALPS
ncbi:putative Orexin receptor type 1-like 3 [Homarus americanus]|uniref:Putative Orexin receptor type 1-like 3 n=1 Tax=Homarus americanus TaxID=6706 RepID=A0A8J5JCM3_HOMAM|nr:putative Orexin receptor type 1-like 3 [Homarus americanus]